MFFTSKVNQLRSRLRNEASQLLLTLRPTYVKAGKFAILNLLNGVNIYMRHLIIVDGKNPDAEPVLPKPSPVRPSFRFSDRQPPWLTSSFKDPKKHPLFKGYTSYEEKETARPVLQVAKVEIPMAKDRIIVSDTMIVSAVEKSDFVEVVSGVRKPSPEAIKKAKANGVKPEPIIRRVRKGSFRRSK